MIPAVVAPPQSPSGAAEPYAALDLGSNSFHLLVAEYRAPPGASARAASAASGRLQVVDRHREAVRLAEGLDASNAITAAASNRALECLGRIGQRIRHLPPTRVRVVGTNALRRARNGEAFIAEAERALGHRVEVVSGREEARLIYLGVSHSLEAAEAGESRLVVDIGGGSTELILGARFEPRLMESLYMGCVSLSATFFADGRVTAARFAEAENVARQELEPVERSYRDRGWNTAIGASGTLIALRDAIAERSGQQRITVAGIAALKRDFIAAGAVDALALNAVDAERAPVFPGGLAIAAALFDALRIDAMTVSTGALREGLLHDLLGRVNAVDIRETTVADLMRRYHVDAAHAERVAATAAMLLEQTRWSAPDGVGDVLSAAGAGRPASPPASGARLLRWGALLHEIGLDIAHSQYHKHGGYLLDNMDLPGFSRSEQHDLATLVRVHRRKFRVTPLGTSAGLAALCVLLRLAVVLHRGRSTLPLPRISARWAPAPGGGRGELALTFPAEWLAANPLTQLDLRQEAGYLASAGITLKVRSLI